MIKLTTSNSEIDAFVNQLRLEMARLDREISKSFYDWTIKVLQIAAENTPQFSSDTVRNWNYSVGHPDLSYTESPEKYEFAQAHSMRLPYSRGDAPGVQEAMQKAKGQRQPTWRDMVYIANGAPAAILMEGQQIALRPVNLIPSAQIMIDYTLTVAATGGLQP